MWNTGNADIISKMQQGSFKEFDQFYKNYIPFVYRIALQMMKDRMEAEDVCQDVFLEVMHKFHQYEKERGSIESWLAVKTRSRCLDRLRRNRKYAEVQWEESDLSWNHTDGTEHKVLVHLEREMLNQAMGRIPVPQRQAIQGMYFESYSQRELSEKMGRPLGTVKSLIRYGLRNLKKQIAVADQEWLQASKRGAE